MLKYMKGICAGVLLFLSAQAAFAALPSDERIYVQMQAGTDAHRRWAAKAALLDTVEKRYLANPASFTIRSYDEAAPDGVIMTHPAQPQTLPQVLQAASVQFDSRSTSVDFASNPEVSLFLGVVGVGGAAAAPITTGILSAIGTYVATKFKPDPANYDSTPDANFQAMADGALEVLESRPKSTLAQMLLGDARKNFRDGSGAGINLRGDLSTRPEVMQYKNAVAQEQLTGAIEVANRSIEEAQVANEQIKALAVELLKRQKDADARERLLQQQAAARAALSTKFDVALGILNLANTNHRFDEEIQKVAKVKQLAEQINAFSAAKFAAGSLAMANGYVQIANLAMGLFAKNNGQSEMQAVMSQLQQISEQIETLRKEMHQRFDAIDYQLAKAIDLARFSYINLTNHLTDLQAQVAAVQTQIDASTTRVITRIAQIGNARYVEIVDACLGRLEGGVPTPSPAQYDRCLRAAALRGFDEAIYPASLNEFPDRIRAEADGDYPFSTSYLNISHLAILPDDADFFGSIRITSRWKPRYSQFINRDALAVPNPIMWVDSTDDFLKIYKRGGALRTRTPIGDFDALLYAGRRLSDFHTLLAYRSSAQGKYMVRRPLLDRLLTRYKSAARGAYPELSKMTVIETNFDTDGTRLPFSVGGGPDQSGVQNYALPLLRNEREQRISMRACEDISGKFHYGGPIDLSQRPALRGLHASEAFNRDWAARIGKTDLKSIGVVDPGVSDKGNRFLDEYRSSSRSLSNRTFGISRDIFRVIPNQVRYLDLLNASYGGPRVELCVKQFSVNRIHPFPQEGAGAYYIDFTYEIAAFVRENAVRRILATAAMRTDQIVLAAIVADAPSLCNLSQHLLSGYRSAVLTSSAAADMFGAASVILNAEAAPWVSQRIDQAVEWFRGLRAEEFSKIAGTVAPETTAVNQALMALYAVYDISLRWGLDNAESRYLGSLLMGNDGLLTQQGLFELLMRDVDENRYQALIEQRVGAVSFELEKISRASVEVVVPIKLAYTLRALQTQRLDLCKRMKRTKCG